MVLRRCFHFTKKIDERAKLQALSGMRRKRPIFVVTILNLIQKSKLYVLQRIRILQTPNTSLCKMLAIRALLYASSVVRPIEYRYFHQAFANILQNIKKDVF